MANIPLEQMADKGYENMPEWAGYILSEWKAHAKILTLQLESKLETREYIAFANQVADKLDNQVSPSEYSKAISLLSDKIDNAATPKDLQTIWKSAENLFADKREYLALAKTVSELADYRAEVEDLKKSVNTIANNNDKHQWYETTVEVSSAELLALNATPKTLVSAPGAGRFIEIAHMQLFYDYNSAAYTVGGGNDLSVEYSSGEQLIQVEATGLLDQTSDQRRFVSGGGTITPVDDKAVVLKMLSSEVTGGDAPLKIKVCYRVMESLS